MIKIKKYMKKILIIQLLFFLIAVQCTSKAFSSEDSTDTIRNVDRGFYVLLQEEMDNNNSILKDVQQKVKDINIKYEDVSLISFQINLKNYVENTKISANKINEINDCFDEFRKNGYKVIFRVVYDSKGKKNPEPEFSDILAHIEQLKSVYNKNEDILYVVEAGYLGAYGEWHDGKYDKEIEKRNQIVEKLLEVIPESVQISLRKPNFITDYIGNNETVDNKNAYSDEKIARLGLHNDGYLASETDLGTYYKSERTQSIAWQEKQTKYTLFGGECQNKDSIYTNLDMAIQDMKKRHCTYLNKTYDKEVKEKWKGQKYNGDDSKYIEQTGYKYIQDHLGYRLVLTRANLTTVSGNRIRLDAKIENKGFAAIIKRKQIDLILYGNQNKYRINLDDDIRKYQKNIDYEFEIEGKIPEELKSGQYKAFLSITEPFDTLKNRAEYQIKLSNNGIWDQEINSNYIGDIFIDDNNISSNANLSGKENNSEIRFYIVATIGIIVCLILIRILSK